jgi:hypothetical protein
MCATSVADNVTLAVADRLALADLVHNYAAGVDDRDFGRVVRLFTNTAELVLPDPPRSLEPVIGHRGHSGINSALDTLAEVTRTEHAIIGEVYRGGPRRSDARGRIACIAHHWTDRNEQATDLVWHVRYDDEYLLTESGWRIRRRALTINAIETRPLRRLRP